MLQQGGIFCDGGWLSEKIVGGDEEEWRQRSQCQRTIRERSKLQKDNHTVRTPPALTLRFDDLAEFVTQWLAPDAAIQKGLAKLLAVFGRGSEIL